MENLNNEISIKNPLKFEALCYFCNGIFAMILSIVLLISLRKDLLNTNTAISSKKSIGFLVLFGIGLYFLVKGIAYLVKKFHLDSSSVSGLAKENNINNRYSLNKMLDMLRNRYNPMLEEKTEGSFAYYLMGFYPKLRNAPKKINDVAVSFFSRILVTFFYVLLYGIAFLSGLFEAFGTNGTVLLNYFGWTLFGILSFVWGRYVIDFITGRTYVYNGNLFKTLGLYILLCASIPPILIFIEKQGTSFVEIKINSILWIASFFIGVSIILLIKTLLMKNRNYINPFNVSISKAYKNWNNDINPNDFFYKLESNIKNGANYKKYLEKSPELFNEGNENKGSFEGMLLYETFENITEQDKSNFKPITLLGHIIFAFIVAIFFYHYFMIEKGSMINTGSKLFLVINSMIFSGISLSLIHIYWMEFNYNSSIILFEIKGTYNKATTSLGNSYNDSFRKEADEVRSNAHIHLYVAKLNSSSIGVGGQRVIQQITEDLETSKKLVNLLEESIKNKKSFDNFNNPDVNVIDGIASLNKKALNMKTSQNSEVLINKNEKFFIEEDNEKQSLECTECGEKLSNGSKFCNNCGFKLV